MSGQKVVRLGPHNRMTPEEALAEVSAEEWDEVLIVGFHKGDDEISVRTSHMTRELALWLVEHAKLHVLG